MGSEVQYSIIDVLMRRSIGVGHELYFCIIVIRWRVKVSIQLRLPQLNGWQYPFSGSIIYKCGQSCRWAGIVLVTPQKQLAVATNLSHSDPWSTLVVENGVQVAKSTRNKQFRQPETGCLSNIPNIALWSFLPLLPCSPC
jgi:hypothetical protein